MKYNYSHWRYAFYRIDAGGAGGGTSRNSSTNTKNTAASKTNTSSTNKNTSSSNKQTLNENRQNVQNSKINTNPKPHSKINIKSNTTSKTNNNYNFGTALGGGSSFAKNTMSRSDGFNYLNSAKAKNINKDVTGTMLYSTRNETIRSTLDLNANKSTVANNSITYNTASSVNLMSDRKGNLSTPLNDGNIRYYGANPNNYIYFNCSDYSNQNADTCELWRIIGVFDGKVKIMRSTPIESLARDRTQSSISSPEYNANWATSSITTLLNESYYKGDTAGTITYYSGSGRTITTTLDMNKIGIKNDTTRNMISESTWRIGYGNTGFPNAVYSKEEESYSSYSSKWIGNIALLNLSDYSYAVDLNQCTVSSTKYSTTECASNNWMHSIITTDTWTLDDSSISNERATRAYYIPSTGIFDSATTLGAKSIYPTVFLKTLTNIKNGTTGSSDNPFQIKVS